jgi:threonine dehydratase
MIAGIAIAAKAINLAIRILSTEPKGADDAPQSKAAGRVIKLHEINTIASRFLEDTHGKNKSLAIIYIMN